MRWLPRTQLQLVAAIRKVARVVPGAAEVTGRVCRLDYSTPGTPSIDWDDAQAQQNLVSDLVNDALSVLTELAGENAPEREDKAADAVGLLALVAGQDVEPAEDSDGTDGRWRSARTVAHDRVISTVDPRDPAHPHVQVPPQGWLPWSRRCRTGDRADHRLRTHHSVRGCRQRPGGRRGSRDRYHQTSTQTKGKGKGEAEGAPALIGREQTAADGTDKPITAGPDAAGPDAERAAPSRPARAGDEPDATAVGTEPARDQHDDDRDTDTDTDTPGQGLEVYGDSAYGTGQARAWYREAGHDTVIKPKPLRPAVPGGLPLDDFIIHEANGAVTCPGGHTRAMSPKRTVTFGKVCAGCPLRPQCTTAAEGRSMTLHPHEEPLRAARAHARTPEFTQAHPTRSTVERIIAWTATRTGRRITLRYIGVTKNDAVPHPPRRDQPAHPHHARPHPPQHCLRTGLTGPHRPR